MCFKMILSLLEDQYEDLCVRDVCVWLLSRCPCKNIFYLRLCGITQTISLHFYKTNLFLVLHV